MLKPFWLKIRCRSPCVSICLCHPALPAMESLPSRSRRRRDRLRRTAILKSKTASCDLYCRLWTDLNSTTHSDVVTQSTVQDQVPAHDGEEEKGTHLVDRLVSFLRPPSFTWNIRSQEFMPQPSHGDPQEQQPLEQELQEQKPQEQQLQQ